MTALARAKLAIAPATSPDDLVAIRWLFLDYAGTLSFSLAYQDFEAELAGLPGDYAPPAGALLLGRVDGRPRGCVGLRDLGCGRAEMKRLYVQPPARGSGLGRALVEAIVAEAARLGHAAIRLDTISGEHDEAIQLYRGMGFVEIAPYYATPIRNTLFLELAF